MSRHDYCHGCRKRELVHRMYEVDMLTCRQTHSSPAEWETVLVCYDCFHRGEVDEAYERANLVWRETHGGEL